MAESFSPDQLNPVRAHFIGGRYVAAGSGRGVRLIRPSDGLEWGEIPCADEREVDVAVRAARNAFLNTGWAHDRPRLRTDAMHRWAELILAHAEELARLEAVVSTRPVSHAEAGDVRVAAEQISFFAELADKLGGNTVPTELGTLGMTLTEPYGVVGAITPWNVPLSMAAWKVAPAIAAGNAIVLKPSELTPFSTLRIAELAVEAGIPAGIINIVVGDGTTTGRAIVCHPNIAKVSFTGSTPAGSAIMSEIGAIGIKPLTLELGGKSPQLVFDSADVEKAAEAIAFGIMNNAGQTCVAGSRVIVHNTVKGALVEALSVHLARYRAGATWEASTDYGPLVSSRQLDRVTALTEGSGGRIACGGHRLDREGYFFAPTLLIDLPLESPALREEIFGPVLTLQTFDTEAEGIAMAQHEIYGLAAGVYARDMGQALRAAKALQVGQVWVNRYGRSRDHILPTGGYKRSGIGKDLGLEAFKANRQSKSVLIALEGAS